MSDATTIILGLDDRKNDFDHFEVDETSWDSSSISASKDTTTHDTAIASDFNDDKFEFVMHHDKLKWINPETGLPFKIGHLFRGKCFQKHDKKAPQFVSVEAQKRQKFNLNKTLQGEKRTVSGVAWCLAKQAKERAKKRGGRFTLTHEWIVDNIEKGCALTGIPFRIACENKKRGGQAPSIDRIDSHNSDQTPENCRVVLDQVNAALNVFSIQDSAVILRRYLNHLTDSK